MKSEIITITNLIINITKLTKEKVGLCKLNNVS